MADGLNKRRFPEPGTTSREPGAPSTPNNRPRRITAKFLAAPVFPGQTVKPATPTFRGDDPEVWERGQLTMVFAAGYTNSLHHEYEHHDVFGQTEAFEERLRSSLADDDEGVDANNDNNGIIMRRLEEGVTDVHDAGEMQRLTAALILNGIDPNEVKFDPLSHLSPQARIEELARLNRKLLTQIGMKLAPSHRIELVEADDEMDGIELPNIKTVELDEI